MLTCADRHRLHDYDAAQRKLAMALGVPSTNAAADGIDPQGEGARHDMAAEFCARLEFDRSTPIDHLQRLAAALRYERCTSPAWQRCCTTPVVTTTPRVDHSNAAYADERHGLSPDDYLQVLQLPGSAATPATTDRPSTPLRSPELSTSHRPATAQSVESDAGHAQRSPSHATQCQVGVWGVGLLPMWESTHTG